MQDIINGRCGWTGGDALYARYHDEEWGKPVRDERVLFEFLLLESAQAGLSWITILNMTEDDAARLMNFDGIVKNRRKIEAAIGNAGLFLTIQEEYGSFYNYIRGFFPDEVPVVHHFKHLSDIPATSPESDAISKDMKRRGFKFFGSTICYAFLQATGFVDDHLEDCLCRRRI